MSAAVASACRCSSYCTVTPSASRRNRCTAHRLRYSSRCVWNSMPLTRRRTGWRFAAPASLGRLPLMEVFVREAFIMLCSETVCEIIAVGRGGASAPHSGGSVTRADLDASAALSTGLAARFASDDVATLSTPFPMTSLLSASSDASSGMPKARRTAASFTCALKETASPSGLPMRSDEGRWYHHARSASATTPTSIVVPCSAAAARLPSASIACTAKAGALVAGLLELLPRSRSEPALPEPPPLPWPPWPGRCVTRARRVRITWARLSRVSRTRSCAASTAAEMVPVMPPSPWWAASLLDGGSREVGVR
mmetsp:Transcript_40979/g.126534  ORF Transcript_40979/g.126534 Transcript_40979/m.126534 type:complete len:310 (+) Transcript_40979:2149-3078(+)